MKNIEAVQNHKYDFIKAKDYLDVSIETVNEIFKFHKSIGNKKTPLIKPVSNTHLTLPPTPYV